MMMETCAGLARDTATRAAANKIKSYLWEWLKRVVSVVSSQVCTNIHCMHAMLEDGRAPICDLFLLCVVTGKGPRHPRTLAPGMVVRFSSFSSVYERCKLFV